MFVMDSRVERPATGGCANGRSAPPGRPGWLWPATGGCASSRSTWAVVAIVGVVCITSRVLVTRGNKPQGARHALVGAAVDYLIRGGRLEEEGGARGLP